jgi:NADH-quinone oxidoreductase subunit C
MFSQKPALDQVVVAKLQDSFGEAVVSAETMLDMLVVTVKSQNIKAVIQKLYDDSDLQFQFLTTLCGMHLPGQEEELAVVYHLHSFSNNHRIRLKTYLKIDSPHIQTLTGIFPTANWMERETYEFYGVIFDGHPNLKRILNVDDFEGFPLRKDFPLEDQTREDKNDNMFGR